MFKSKIALTVTGIALALLSAAPSAVAAPEPEPSLTPMIIDGNTATSGPWAARLFANGRQTCSATIIAPQYVLTAKHCVASGTISFRIGSLDQTTGGTTATAVQITRHSGSDLAIAKLDRSVNATYAPLGTSTDVRVGQTVQVYGWGATCTNQPEINCQSRYLKYANVRVSSVNARDAYGGVAVRATRIDGITAGGDSGGPMFASGKQVGVASTSDRQSVTNYTNVASYRTWIRSVAGV
ncbi:hydrolase [Alloactinosynnema sp. L-07]|uniref:S1 family peptidase n=1 Tax=Alloactinosynnema sp. L-07 TaxID=1653480 RepID=UPI00065EF470|nr:trypsin-like serine protease [Alloactinosynnema sp. L-07]CRK57458.1 hydrolase [Alloactinosynnema sp. L-07]